VAAIYGEVAGLSTRYKALLEQVLGSEHPDTLGTQHALVNLYKNQGKKKSLIPTIVGKLKRRPHMD
jgi:hypothetical protein